MFNDLGQHNSPTNIKKSWRRGWPRSFGAIILVLTPEYLLPSQLFRSSLLLFYFLNRPNRCSHCTKVWHKTYRIYGAPLSRSARRSFAHPSQKSRLHNLYLVCVNRSPTRYGLAPSQKLFGSIVWTPIRYVTLQFRDRRGAASPCHGNRAEITVLIYEQKPCDPVWFSRRRKSYQAV